LERGRIGSWWGNWRGRDHWGDLGVGVLFVTQIKDVVGCDVCGPSLAVTL